jgi:Ca-activated chloride channel family protein
MATPSGDVVLDVSRIRIATAKDKAVELSDKRDFGAASQVLRDVMDSLRKRGLHERFEVAEELEQLDYFAERIEQNRLSGEARKEMRDQSFQGQTRNRADLTGRGVSSGGSAASLDRVSEVGAGVELVCLREGGKLRMRVLSDGYDKEKNVQFPRAIRDEGIHYVVDGLEESADGSFYRVTGNIKRLAKAGEADRYTITRSAPRTPSKPMVAPPSAADLETTDSVGDGVLIQVIKDGSKLRARVVSDGFDPNWNIQVPRSIREEGTLYVADEVSARSDGKSYTASGKIRRFVQTT